ncbi:MAG: LysE family transporter [Anaerolineae bacterium]
MSLLFAYALGLGIAYCAPPGAVNAESIRRGLARGFWASLRVQVGSLIGDTTWAVVALFGAAYLVQNHTARLVLGVIGVVLLGRLAWSALRDAWRPSGAATPDAAAPSGGSEPAVANATRSRSDFATGAVLSLANPWGVAFWLGVGSAVVTGGVTDPQPAQLAVFLGGFILGAMVWCLALASLVGWGRRFVGGTFFRWVNLTCGLALSYFAVRFALNLLPTIEALLL